ncbi:hypothetical protein HN695_07890 [Candidatus Woesearchaeota archaeon]|jgi:hypothetical protein|nr:hypothetical protein [Candidatus Woesearchaeota archaeon]MBT5272462.1 hypothetical protein [Candidatus Woesearchaeota archaeon]MBT6041530.1 hypothetical protein [Candidatus Woesearchaeota archaeon]MBT6336324.1 hypothetical protein [Candidatus Woesearchaeota archaeon]MBT7928226.1 hypothetical protein [Candidatus Woesearchaeota archaeon]
MTIDKYVDFINPNKTPEEKIIEIVDGRKTYKFSRESHSTRGIKKGHFSKVYFDDNLEACIKVGMGISYEVERNERHVLEKLLEKGIISLPEGKDRRTGEFDYPLLFIPERPKGKKDEHIAVMRDLESEGCVSLKKVMELDLAEGATPEEEKFKFKGKALPLEHALAIYTTLLGKLSILHDDAELIHTDLKAANIFVQYDRLEKIVQDGDQRRFLELDHLKDLKVMDFGLARERHERCELLFNHEVGAIKDATGDYSSSYQGRRSREVALHNSEISPLELMMLGSKNESAQPWIDIYEASNLFVWMVTGRSAFYLGAKHIEKYNGILSKWDISDEENIEFIKESRRELERKRAKEAKELLLDCSEWIPEDIATQAMGKIIESKFEEFVNIIQDSYSQIITRVVARDGAKPEDGEIMSKLYPIIEATTMPDPKKKEKNQGYQYNDAKEVSGLIEKIMLQHPSTSDNDLVRREVIQDPIVKRNYSISSIDDQIVPVTFSKNPEISTSINEGETAISAVEISQLSQLPYETESTHKLEFKRTFKEHWTEFKAKYSKIGRGISYILGGAALLTALAGGIYLVANSKACTEDETTTTTESYVIPDATPLTLIQDTETVINEQTQDIISQPENEEKVSKGKEENPTTSPLWESPQEGDMSILSGFGEDIIRKGFVNASPKLETLLKAESALKKDTKKSTGETKISPPTEVVLPQPKQPLEEKVQDKSEKPTTSIKTLDGKPLVTEESKKPYKKEVKPKKPIKKKAPTVYELVSKSYNTHVSKPVEIKLADLIRDSCGCTDVKYSDIDSILKGVVEGHGLTAKYSARWGKLTITPEKINKKPYRGNTSFTLKLNNGVTKKYTVTFFNNPPVRGEKAEDLVLVGEEEKEMKINLQDYFTDPDGKPTAYKIIGELQGEGENNAKGIIATPVISGKYLVITAEGKDRHTMGKNGPVDQRAVLKIVALDENFQTDENEGAVTLSISVEDRNDCPQLARSIDDVLYIPVGTTVEIGGEGNKSKPLFKDKDLGGKQFRVTSDNDDVKVFGKPGGKTVIKQGSLPTDTVIPITLYAQDKQEDYKEDEKCQDEEGNMIPFKAPQTTINVFYHGERSLKLGGKSLKYQVNGASKGYATAITINSEAIAALESRINADHANIEGKLVFDASGKCIATSFCYKQENGVCNDEHYSVGDLQTFLAKEHIKIAEGDMIKKGPIRIDINGIK